MYDDSQSAKCPTAEDLVAFSRGQLPENALETIAQHIAGCPACETSINELLASDTLGPLLPAAAQPDFLDESACDRLETNARALPVAADQSTTLPEKVPEGVDTAVLPRLFASYELIELIGRGGEGIVYRARHVRLNRLVALKVIRNGAYATEAERLRFSQEGETIARIKHPNIVEVFDSGICDDQMFMAMELLEGGDLTTRLRQSLMSEREAAGLVCTLARAMHAVHACGIIHRDLKPRNVVFTADGIPKITDFGLAKLLDAAGGPTKTVAIMGTAPYMAPEQAEGRSRQATPATDVYALGAILYECLTRQPPFQASTTEETLQLVRFKQPKPPSRIRPGLPKALEDICLKCLEKKPSWRHRSAAELADRLQSFLDGKERPKHWYQRAGWAIRRRAGIAACVALVFFLSAAVWGTIYWRDPARVAEQIEGQLEANKAVTLIEDTDVPRYGRWAMGQEFSQISTNSREPFSIHSDNLALYDLVRDPKHSHFCLRAQVQHNVALDDKGNSQVGIFVARTGYTSGGGTTQHVVRFTFNDIVDEREVYEFAVRNIEPRLRWKKPRGNPTDLESRLFFDLHGLGDHSLGLCGEQTPDLFEAGRAFGGIWRDLQLEVSPEEIKAYWGNTFAGKLTAKQLGPISRAIVQEEVERNRLPDVAYLMGFEPEYAPRGSVGLCVFAGTASFRRVVLEPLSP